MSYSGTPLRCGMHHLMDEGAWLEMSYMRWICNVCERDRVKIAANCSPCVVCVCVGCVEAHGENVSFALHKAQSGHGKDAELKHFQRTQAHVVQLEARLQEAERDAENLRRRLAQPAMK